MTFTAPSEDDLEKLISFHNQLDEHFNREDEHNPTLDLIRSAFDRYLNTAEHAETWCVPYPPISRDTFYNLTQADREEKIKQQTKTQIQEYMQNAALLSHIHDVTLESIKGLDQSPDTLRQKIQENRNDNQGQLADYK